MIEIKNCKKCGGKAKLYCGLDDKFSVACEVVECNNISENAYRNEKRAIEEWNNSQ